MRELLLVVAVLVISVVFPSPNASQAMATQRGGSDGERAYELSCSILWMGGNLAACRELNWHPCRSSNPQRPAACDAPPAPPRPVPKEMEW